MPLIPLSYFSILNQSTMNSHRVERVVYNDRLGYAVIYYNPITSGGVKVPRSEDICERRRRQALQPFDDPIDEKFIDEIEAMVRKKERDAASKEIEHICDEINDLFRDVEQLDLKHRDILNSRVREQIKGKSANDICDILVKDVLNHTNPIYNRVKQDTFPHKMKYKILAAGVKRAPSPPPERHARKLLEEDLRERNEEKKKQESAIKRIEKYMDENVMTEVYGRKYKREIDRIQNDIKALKYRCTEKINFR